MFVANPNNPTGTWLAPDALEAFIASVPRDVLIVLDEAYNEYLEPAERAERRPGSRAIRTWSLSRTFSKAYGLAALRVGYGIMDPTVADMLQPRAAAVQRQRVRAGGGGRGAGRYRVRRGEPRDEPRGLAQLERGPPALGIGYVPSHGNFLLVKWATRVASTSAC